MILHACDKCGKKLPKPEKENCKNRPFHSDEMYRANEDKTHKIKINGQMVEVHVKITLACGQPLEVCHECGWNILEVMADRSGKSKKGKK